MTSRGEHVLAEHDDEEKRRNRSKQAPASIAQIENLQLPKRAEKRRSVYLGEQLSCAVRIGEHEVRVEVIDLSSQGLALVEVAERLPTPYAVGQAVQLAFDRGLATYFAIEAIISNISQVTWGGRPYKRLGIRFAMSIAKSREDFAKALAQAVVPCRTAIRPQASLLDPFFFNELMLLQIEGFTAQGMEALVSERCKTLLPNQPLDIDVHVPGRGRFLVGVINSPLQMRGKDNRFRVYLRYQKPDPRFLEAVSEYLIMFGLDVTPAYLRQEGFAIGELGHACEVSYASIGEDLITNENLRPISFGFPFDLTARQHKLGPYSRTLRCKLGPHLIAVMALTFVEGDLRRSFFQAHGHKISAKILAARHIELSDFYMSSKAELVDFLLPLLRHLVRIAVQSKSQFLLLECSDHLKPILQKIGFQDQGPGAERPGEDGRPVTYHLQALPITEALLNKDKLLPDSVWRRVYRELFEFFKTQAQKKRQASKSAV